MEINCEFKYVRYSSVLFYSCEISNAFITEKNHAIKEFKGVHERGKSHNDVKQVRFIEQNVNYFPRGLEKHFPNLTQLVIHGCGIEEISKNDLIGLEGLELLWIQNCQLTSLPDDLFTEMPNLRTVSFIDNKIEFASSNLLKPLLGREDVVVNLKGNKNVDDFYSPDWRGSTDSLEKLMKLIDENCKKPLRRTVVPDPANFNPKLKEMWVSGRFSDLTIIVGAKKFKVHKTILGMQSELFGQIFEDQSEATEIKIPDFSSNSVESLLKFIYTNEISEVGNSKENFDIADKFKVAEMKTIYEKIICDELDEANAWENFLFAHRFSSQLLKEEAFQMISNQINAKKIPNEVPVKLMEDPEKLKKLFDHLQAVEEILADK